MNDHNLHLQRLIRMLILSMAVAVLGYGFSSYTQFFAGAFLGLLISLVNALFTAFKIHKISEATMKGAKRPGLGTLSRLSMAALGTLIVLRYPDQLSIIGLVSGFLLSPVLLIGGSIYALVKENKKNKGKG